MGHTGIRRHFPDRPQLVDVTKAPDQLGLPPNWISYLSQVIIQGTEKKGPKPMNQPETRLSAELRRVLLGPNLDEAPNGAGTVRFIAKSPSNAEEVLKDARAILSIVNQHGNTDWPTDDKWASLLPTWFVQRCPPPRTRKDVETDLAFYSELSSQEQIQWTRKTRWPLLDWLEYFKPNKREWYWWDAKVVHPNFLVVAVEVDGWPFSWVSLSWLLRACGAETVDPEEDVLGDLILAGIEVQ